MNETMRALVYQGPGRMELEARPIPLPGRGEVQIRVRVCSICGSDLGAYRHASARFAPPLVLGHEFAGDITAVGPEVDGLAVGQKVTVNPMVTCNHCFYCDRGQGNLCGNRRSMGTAIGGVPTDGAMREYVTVPAWMVVPLPTALSYTSGAMLEPCGVTLACAKMGRTADEGSVMVTGAGPIGLLVVKFLKALGTPRILVSDIAENRLQMAAACGADQVIRADREDAVAAVGAATDGRGADRVILAAGVGETVGQAFRMARNGGTVVLVALMHEPITIDPMEIVGRELKFIGSYMFTTEMAEAAALIADGRLQVEDLITATYPLHRGKEAMDLLNTPGNSEVKVQITM